MKHKKGFKRSIVLTAPQCEFVKREADRLDICEAEVIRRIIDLWRDSNVAS